MTVKSLTLSQRATGISRPWLIAHARAAAPPQTCPNLPRDNDDGGGGGSENSTPTFFRTPRPLSLRVRRQKLSTKRAHDWYWFVLLFFLALE